MITISLWALSHCTSHSSCPLVRLVFLGKELSLLTEDPYSRKLTLIMEVSPPFFKYVQQTFFISTAEYRALIQLLGTQTDTSSAAVGLTF